MSDENDKDTVPARGMRRAHRILVIALATALAFAGIYAILGEKGKHAPKQDEPRARAAGALDPALATGDMRRLVIHQRPRELPTFTFLDAKERERRLSEWRGKVVMINFWATWCPPCRKEMPEIAKLQEKYAERGLVVLAISEDYKGYDWAWQGLRMLGAQNLALFMDNGGRALRAVRGAGLPVSLLIDRHGREVARLTGEARWFSPQAQAVIEALLAQK